MASIKFTKQMHAKNSLRFVQHLDDIAFSLAKMDVFGKKMQRACTAKCFRAEFEQRRFGRNKNMTVFLKALYFFNLCVMLAGMCYVTVKQVRGDYQHSSITVDFGNTIWESSWAKVSWWMNSTQEYEEGPLVCKLSCCSVFIIIVSNNQFTP